MTQTAMARENIIKRRERKHEITIMKFFFMFLISISIPSHSPFLLHRSVLCFVCRRVLSVLLTEAFIGARSNLL